MTVRVPLVAFVLAGTMIGWMGLQWLGGKMGWETRFVFLFDFLAIAAFVWALSFAGFGYIFGKALEKMIGNIVLAFGITMLVMFSLVLIGTYVAKRRRQRQLLVPPAGAAKQAGEND